MRATELERENRALRKSLQELRAENDRLREVLHAIARTSCVPTTEAVSELAVLAKSRRLLHISSLLREQQAETLRWCRSVRANLLSGNGGRPVVLRLLEQYTDVSSSSGDRRANMDGRR